MISAAKVFVITTDKSTNRKNVSDSMHKELITRVRVNTRYIIHCLIHKGGREGEGSTADTARKRPERPWTAARTMEVLRRCPLAIAQRLVHRAIAVSTAVLGRVTKTMSVALLLTNNSKRKKSNFRSPAPPPCS